MEELYRYECKLKNGKKYIFHFTDRRIEELLNSYEIPFKAAKRVNGIWIKVGDKQ